MKTQFITAMLLLCVTLVTAQEPMDKKKTRETIFPKGQKGPAETFTGTIWHHALTTGDTMYTTQIGHVEFEPGARTNWHSHPSGQILIVLSGVGHHQIEDGPIETLKKGDVAKCPPNVSHWHGASKNESMKHIYVLPNTEKGLVEWGQPVIDEQYSND